MKTTRILYLVPDLFGPPSGIARYCRMVCHALAGQGVPLRVLALLDQPSECRTATQLWPHAQYRPCAGSRPLFVQRALQARRIRPRVIMVGHPNFSSLGYLLARLCGAKLCIFMYGVDIWAPLPVSRRWSLQQADQWIAISHFTAREAAKANGLPLEKIRVLYNCVDPQLQSLPCPTGNSAVNPAKETQNLSLLTVARLLKSEQYKGHDQVIKAMPALLQRFPHLVYHIVGDGTGRAELETLAAREAVTQAVQFHGFVDEDEMKRRYAEASVFIMPSRREGFGFVFIEAMSQGTPAIGGNMDATPEVIADGQTGYLVDPTSVSDIVEKTAALLADPQLRQQMGEAALRRTQENFGFACFQQQLLKYLQELNVQIPPQFIRIK